MTAAAPRKAREVADAPAIDGGTVLAVLLVSGLLELLLRGPMAMRALRARVA
jgi:hypothetical protein